MTSIPVQIGNTRGTITVGGNIREIIDRDGKKWRFEDHGYFGPHVVNENDDPLDKQPSARSPFWQAVQNWADQGRKMADDGMCGWMHPPEPIVEMFGKRTGVIVGYEPAKHGWPIPSTHSEASK